MGTGTTIRFISGSPSLVEENGIKIGRLSGIVNHHEPFYLKGMLLPSKETNKIKNWEEKIEKIVEETLGEDLRVIGGIPPWIQITLNCSRFVATRAVAFWNNT